MLRMRTGISRIWVFRLAAASLGLAMAATINPPVGAVPSFTDQTGQPCQACHVGGFGPQLTDFGREFKLGGYTMRAKAALPIAAMAVASFTHTARDQNPPAPYFTANDNAALDQVSLFIAGGAGQHVGGFSQITYDGVARQFHWDNLDLRVVNSGQVLGKDATYGLTFNNSPTVQDPWNSTPAWGFPYTASALAPTPGAAPLIDGGLAQTVVGLSAYGWFNHHLYLEAGGYSSPAAGTLSWLGMDPSSPGDLAGIAPYGRIGYQLMLAGGTAHVGAFGLWANINPGRDRSSGQSDHYADIGADASWQRTVGSGDMIAANLRYVHETSQLRASCALGLLGDGSTVDCANTALNEWRSDVTYVWHGKVDVTLGGFVTHGTANANLYAPTNLPNSNGVSAEIDYTPWGMGNSPLGPRANLRLGLQYTAYGRFDGARFNYDGADAHAADNNTLRLFSWLAF
ncbi:MAG: hypothetical protein KGJ57_10065 [Sphingomonadales bacterium]|nr:hypothetical protein [Sphingomonadales bacterium]MDE2169757.1 hypothetical protein [Sphingomonadales bacterium]